MLYLVTDVRGRGRKRWRGCGASWTNSEIDERKLEGRVAQMIDLDCHRLMSYIAVLHKHGVL